MLTAAGLHRTVMATLASKRLGKPVFVRLLVHATSPVAGAGGLGRLEPWVKVVGDWVGQATHSAYHLSSRTGGSRHETLTLVFRDGATAIVSLTDASPGREGVDLMLLGNQGAIYHRSGGCLDPASAFDLKVEEPQKDAAPSGAATRGKPKYGILLVSGSHTHQENYAAAFGADPRCKLIAVTDELGIDAKRRELNERLARALGVPYFSDLAKALERKDVHVVSVCAPPERRGRIAVQCAQAGKHLYLDKSLAPELKQADAIVAAVKAGGVRSHMFSFIPQPWVREARRILQSDKLGKLLAIHADCFFAKGKTGTAKLGSLRKEEYPPERHQLVEAKRELDNVGVYPITQIRWVTGKKFQSVHGVTANYFFTEHQKHNVEDFGLLSCTLEGDLPVTMAAGRYGWTTHPSSGVNRMILIGSQRSVVVDAHAPRLEVYTDESPWVAPNVNPADPMGFWQSTQDEVHVRPKKTWVPLWPAAGSDASYFLDCLDAGRESEINAAEAAHATEVLLAGYRSAASGEDVRLPLPRS